MSLGSGALWGHAYAAVVSQARRHVQGGGCTSVGVAGLVQSGGFGSFSRGFGSAAAQFTSNSDALSVKRARFTFHLPDRPA